MKKRTINTIGFIVGGIPLLLYPFVVMANIMQLAGVSNNENVFMTLIVNLFIFSSSTYLLTYIVCLVIYIIKRNKDNLISLIPLAQIVITVILFCMWMYIDNS